MNSVFILGAGCSVHAGVPTMPDFFQVVEDLPRSHVGASLPLDAFDLVIRARRELAAVHSKARFDIRNLERVFAAFEMATIFGELGMLSPEDVKRLLPAMRQVIVSTIDNRMLLPVNAQSAIQPPGMYDFFGSMVRHVVERGHRVSVITFNYDVGIDFGLATYGFSLDYCLRPEPSVDAWPLELMKLHGSVNWADCNECHSEVIVHSVLDAVRDVEARHETPNSSVPLSVCSRFGTLEHCGKMRCGPEPIIVPPTADKGGYSPLLLPVWRRAAQRLKEAENIFVIGYSWPDSDQFFRQLYALGSAGGAVLRKFWVVNPDREVAARFQKNLLGPQALDRFSSMPDRFEANVLEGLAETGLGASFKAIAHQTGRRARLQK